MPRPTLTFDTVRQIALALPGVADSAAYRSPALRIRGELLACIPVHRTAELGSVAVRVPFDRRAELLAADPDVYYLPDHYRNYPIVLARLSRIHPDALQGLVRMGWDFVSAKKHGPRRPAKKPKRT